MPPVNTAPVAQDDHLTRSQFPFNPDPEDGQLPFGPVQLADGLERLFMIDTDAPGGVAITARTLRLAETDPDITFQISLANIANVQDIVPLLSGGFIVTGKALALPGASVPRPILAEIFDGAGNRVSDEIVIPQTGDPFYNSAKVTELPDGRLLFAWTEFENAEPSAIKAQIFAADGDPLGDAFNLDITAIKPKLAEVMVADDGRLFVSWRHETHPEFNVSDRDGADGQFFTLDGAAVGAPIVLKENGAEFDDTVVLLPGGGVIYVYPAPDGQGDGIAARFFDAKGALLHEGLVNQRVDHFQAKADAAVMANGQIVMTWWGGFDVDDHDRSAVKARIFNADGSAVGDEFLVNEVAFGEQLVPSVRALDSGQFIISWTDREGLEFDGGSGRIARVFEADGTPASGPFVNASGILTYERLPYLLDPEQFLQNDSDAEGNLLTLLGVSATSALGATVILRSDGTVYYDPTTSAVLRDLDTGETLEDSFTYTLSDGALSDSATAFLTVGGKDEGGTRDWARDDAYELTGFELAASATRAASIADKTAGTHLFANDENPSGVVQTVNGGLSDWGKWFDGNGGGEFRVFQSGAVLFRDINGDLAPGDTTGFSYAAEYHLRNGIDTATVTLTILGDADEPEDVFKFDADALAAAGGSWFRLGAKNDDTDLLENDFVQPGHPNGLIEGVDVIEFVNGKPIEEGVWFDGNGGGQFRVFEGGVLDFRNQGVAIGPDAVTGFDYSMMDGNTEIVSTVALIIGELDFA